MTPLILELYAEGCPKTHREHQNKPFSKKLSRYETKCCDNKYETTATGQLQPVLDLNAPSYKPLQRHFFVFWAPYTIYPPKNIVPTQRTTQTTNTHTNNIFLKGTKPDSHHNHHSKPLVRSSPNASLRRLRTWLEALPRKLLENSSFFPRHGIRWSGPFGPFGPF